MALQRDKSDIQTFIKNKHPEKVDWSNIPDYMDPNEFLKVVQECTGKDTIHRAHFMNWHKKVFGINLLDYGDMKNEVY